MVWLLILVVSGGVNGFVLFVLVFWVDFCVGSDGDVSVVVWEFEFVGG